MSKKIRNYLGLLAYTITGLIFGFAFFLLFLNIYHTSEVNSKYVKSSEEIDVYNDFLGNLTLLKNKIDKINLNDEKQINISNRLNSCVKSLNNEEFLNYVKKKKIDDLDIYQMKNVFQNEIVDGCLVKQLYTMTEDNDNKEVLPFIKNDIDILLASMSYVEDNLLDNSSYKFSSNFSKTNIYNAKQESYYQVVNSYRRVIDLVNIVSDHYVAKESDK